MLELRLNYLDPYVDCFVIVEACQTFSGKSKEFLLEKEFSRYSQFSGKIIYHKIEDQHGSYGSIIEHLQLQSCKPSQKILEILESHNHYPKSALHWVLDTYHRECLHFPLDKIAQDHDLVLLSDLDEIPSAHIFSPESVSSALAAPKVCVQNEFTYYLNYLKSRDWLGTVVGNGKLMTSTSLNSLRIDSKASRMIVSKIPLENGGYHFTSCGSIDQIKAKIQSWSHQEFNNKRVLENIDSKMMSGQDLFGRSHGTTIQKVDIHNRDIYDERMGTLLATYPGLLSSAEIIKVSPSKLKSYYYKVHNRAVRLFDSLSKRLSKIFVG